MDPEAVRRTLLVLLQDADALLAKVEAKHATDRRQAGLLMRLALAAIMGTAAFFAFVYGGGLDIGLLAGALLAVGFAVLQSSVLALYAAYADRPAGPELGLGWPPMKYVTMMGRQEADERLVVERLIEDKGKIILRNAELVGVRRRSREAGFWLLVAAMGLVLTSMALILGGAFLAYDATLATPCTGAFVCARHPGELALRRGGGDSHGEWIPPGPNSRRTRRGGAQDPGIPGTAGE